MVACEGRRGLGASQPGSTVGSAAGEGGVSRGVERGGPPAPREGAQGSSGFSFIVTFFDLPLNASNSVFSVLMLRGDPLSAVLWGWGWFWSCPGHLWGAPCVRVGQRSADFSRLRVGGAWSSRGASVRWPWAGLSSRIRRGVTEPARSRRPGERVRGCKFRPQSPHPPWCPAHPPEATPCHQLPPSRPPGERPMK